MSNSEIQLKSLHAKHLSQHLCIEKKITLNYKAVFSFKSCLPCEKAFKKSNCLYAKIKVVNAKEKKRKKNLNLKSNKNAEQNE